MPHTNHFAGTKSNVFFLLLGPVVLWISAIPSALATPSPSQMRVGVCQLATNPGRQHLDQNLAEISLCLFYQYLAGTQLTVVPEVSDMGFMPHALDPRGYDGDKPIPGLYTDLLGSLARTYQMWIVMGLTEREQYGYRSNTIVAIDHNGDLVKMSRKFRNSIAQGDNYTGTDPFTRTYPVLQGSFQDVSAIDSPWGPLVVGICADMPLSLIHI